MRKEIIIGAVIAIVAVVGVFGWYFLRAPELILSDPVAMVLTLDDLPLGASVVFEEYIPSEFAFALEISESDFQEWGYERGYWKTFAVNDYDFDCLALRFSNVKGAKNTFVAIQRWISSEYGGASWSSLEIGDEGGICMEEPYHAVAFRKANVVAVVVDVSEKIAAIGYAHLMEDKMN